MRIFFFFLLKTILLYTQWENYFFSIFVIVCIWYLIWLLILRAFVRIGIFQTILQ